MEMNLLTEARATARACTDFGKQMRLMRLTDELSNVFCRFAISCSREDMSELVAAWTRVLILLNELPVPTKPDLKVRAQ